MNIRGGSRISGTEVQPLKKGTHGERQRGGVWEAFPRKIWKFKCYMYVFSTSFMYSCKKSRFFSLENVWFCAMNECLFWGKFCSCAMNECLGENFGLKISAGREGCARPAPSTWIRPWTSHCQGASLIFLTIVILVWYTWHHFLSRRQNYWSLPTCILFSYRDTNVIEVEGKQNIHLSSHVPARLNIQ
jgi:hypothetical protein